MEDLSRHQLILLVLLITFITSIGTGIITFSLLSEAPVEITQQINRVVEKTVERVVTEPGQPEKVVTTVVVTEEDRILEAIAKNEKSIVRLKTVGADGSEVFSGIGIVVSDSGVIVTDLRNYNANSNYTILFSDGKKYSTGKTFFDKENGLVFMSISVPVNENPKYTFYPATFGDSDSLKIGQTLVVVGGKESNAASIGRVRQLSFTEDKTTVTNILSDILFTKTYPGSPALNLSGEIVGIEAPMSEVETQYSYIPINILKDITFKALEELAK